MGKHESSIASQLPQPLALLEIEAGWGVGDLQPVPAHFSNDLVIKLTCLTQICMGSS